MNTPRPKTIFVDVDDTLVRSVGQTRIPMAAVIAHIRRLHDAGHLLYLWSSGGADYARTSAEELKAKLKESEWTDGLSTLSPFMPELVNQLNMRKQQIQFQLAAAQRWPELIDADEAELKELPHYISVIGDAWTAWLDCLGTTPEQEKSFMYLYNSNHLDVLLLEYPRWQASLKAGGRTWPTAP